MARIPLFRLFRQPTDTRRLQNRLQEFIYQLDVGVGVKFLKIGLLFLVALFLSLVYAATQFTGLKEPEAMDMAQVARNMARGEGYVTKVIRPFSLWYLQFERRQEAQLQRHPELFRAPMYPWLLSKMFRMVSRNATFDAKVGDRLVVLGSLAWIMPSLALVYLLGRAWFDRRVGVLSAWVYLVSNSVFVWGISGTPIPFLIFVLLASVYFLVLATKRHEAGKKGWVLTGLCLVLSASFLVTGALTRYSFCLWLMPVAVYVWVTFKPRHWVLLGLYLAVFMLPFTMWMGNRMRVSGRPFGLAGFAIKQGTGLLPDNELMRRYRNETVRAKLGKVGTRQVLNKSISNLVSIAEEGIKRIGGNFIIVFFLACLLHPFRRRDVVRALRGILAALCLAVLICALTDGEAGGLMDTFFPLATIFGAAFFWILFDRLDLGTRLKRAALIAVFVGVNAAPLALAVLPPAAASPYPPVRSAWVEKFSAWYRPDEQVASDIPWAVAWYADRHAIWVPWTTREFIDIHDLPAFNLNGLYLTQASFTDTSTEADFETKPFERGEVPADLERPWALLAAGMLPLAHQYPPRGSFPLKVLHAFDFGNVLYAERYRWPIPVPPATPSPPGQE